MNILIFLTAFTAFLFCSNCEMAKFKIGLNKYRILADLIVKIFEQEILKEIAVANLITPDLTTSLAIADFKNELLSRNFRMEKISFHQFSPLHKTQAKSKRKRVSVFPIERIADFEEIIKHLNGNDFLTMGYYIVVLLMGDMPEEEEIFKLFWKKQVFNVLVIYEDPSGAVIFKTFMPFTPGNCSNITPVIVNVFKDGKFMSDINNIFPSKIKNLHKCPIRVSVANDAQPYIIYNQLANGSYHLSGISTSLIETLSESINFKLVYSYLGPAGYLFDNGTAEGSMKELLEGKADLAISYWWLKPNRLLYLDSTNSYITDKVNLVIPPGKEYTTFEHLMYPFSLTSWIMILTAYCIGAFVIFIVKFCSQTVQNFVFGTGVKNPCMNLYIAYFGGAQKVLPKRNFARFLLALYLLYTLVIRTLYQGSYYQFLRSSRLHNRVGSVEEMVQEDFEYYVYSTDADMFEQAEVIKNRYTLT